MTVGSRSARLGAIRPLRSAAFERVRLSQTDYKQALAVGVLFLPWLAIIFVPGHYSWLAWLGLICQALAAVVSVEVSLYSFLALGPINYLVRLTDLSSPVLAISRELAFVLLFTSWLANSKGKPLRNAGAWRGYPVVQSGFYAIMLIFAFQAMRAPSLVAGFASLRETWRFLALFPLVCNVVAAKPATARKLLCWMLVGCTLLGLIELGSYLFSWTPLAAGAYSRFGMSRSVLGYEMQRAVPLNRIGGIAGLTDIVVPGIAIGSLLFAYTRRWRWLALFAAAVPLAFSVLTLSFTLLIAFALAGGCCVLVYSLSVRTTAGLIRFGGLTFALLALLVGGFLPLVSNDIAENPEGGRVSMFAYIRSSAGIYATYLPLGDRSAFLIGYGLRYTGGGETLGEANAREGWTERIDAGWSLLPHMLGFPTAILVVGWLTLILGKGVVGSAKVLRYSSQAIRSDRVALPIATVAYAASFCPVHTIPWMNFSGPDGTFPALAALVYTLSIIGRRSAPQRRLVSLRQEACDTPARMTSGTSRVYYAPR